MASKKFFRPPQNEMYDDDDDDDDDDVDSEDEEEERDDRKRKNGGGGGSKKKRTKHNSFFDEEAEASDEDEDEEEDATGEQMDAEALELMRQQDRRRAMAGRMDRSVHEITRDIEDRHRLQRRTVDRQVFEGDAMGETPAVAQQSLVPSVSDPSLWMISCATGKEQELVMQIMNKASSYARKGQPLGICGAIAAQTKGKIYIESFNEPAVMEAIQGIRGLLQYTMRLVPIADMTTVMTVTTSKKPVRKNEWVRMTRGHYKDDLALVIDVKDSGLKATVQVVPRLDYSLLNLPPEEARVRRRTVRPPQKFFSAQDVHAQGAMNADVARVRFPGTNDYCEYFEGNYYNDGYLWKDVTVGSMIKPCGEDNPPTLDELRRFRKRKKADTSQYDDHEENEGSKVAASLLEEMSELHEMTGLGKGSSSGGSGLLVGDTVEVIEGDLVGMKGKLVSQDESTVKIKPLSSNVDLGGTGEIEFLSSQVRKYIDVGAHVKVTDGRYANETGTVVAVEQVDGDTYPTAVVLTDVTNKEISVRISQLRESAEVASGQDKLQGYELYDLVVLSGGGSANEVGVIVRVGREDFTVINNHGIVRETRPEELRGKRNSASTRAVALDVQGTQLRVGDSVNVAEGPHKGKTATIKRMNRAQLFLHSQTRSEHAGIFVVRSRSCVLAGARNQPRQNGMDGGVSPFATPRSQNSAPQAVGRGRRDDGMVGKTVRIKAGQWKGYLGTVSDATATHLQIELHSRLKKIMIVREKVMVVGDKFGTTEDQDSSTLRQQNMMAPTTPFVAAGQTPMHGGATPMHKGAMEAESEEVWRPGGAVDQENIAVKEDSWDPSGGSSTWNPGAQDDAWGSSSHGADVSTVTNTATVKVETHAADDNDIPVWFMARVWVQVKGKNEQGVIKETEGKTAVVEFSDKSTKKLPVSDLTLVEPKEHDAVLVTGGTDIGLEGSLVCVDGSDAILKDSRDEFKIVEINFLAKVQQ